MSLGRQDIYLNYEIVFLCIILSNAICSEKNEDDDDG